MDSEFWLARWQENRIGFHRTEANPNLVKWWASVGLSPDATVLVPLCGKSKDLLWLGRSHNVLGVELSTAAKEQFWLESSLEPTESIAGPYAVSQNGSVTFLVGDFMCLPALYPRAFEGFYDRAALIALPPEMRRQYADTQKALIKPGGRGLMVTVEYDQTEMQGPPFSVSVEDIRSLYEPEFRVEVLESMSAQTLSPNLTARGVTSLTEHIFLVTRSEATTEAL